MRAYWNGYLKLALVSCPIALHVATSTSKRIACRQINKATGNRLRQRMINLMEALRGGIVEDKKLSPAPRRGASTALARKRA